MYLFLNWVSLVNFEVWRVVYLAYETYNSGTTYWLCNGFEWFTAELGELVCQENTRDTWDILQKTTKNHCITILYHAIENFGVNRKRAILHGNVGWYTAEYTTAFLHSDWLYFPWRGIKFGTREARQHKGNATCLSTLMERVPNTNS